MIEPNHNRVQGNFRNSSSKIDYSLILHYKHIFPLSQLDLSAQCRTTTKLLLTNRKEKSNCYQTMRKSGFLFVVLMNKWLLLEMIYVSI